MARTAPGLDRTFWIRFFAILLIALVIVWIALSILSGSANVAFRVLAIILPVTFVMVGTCYLFLLLVVLIHEIGHLVGGKLVGFQFRSMIVGPVEMHVTTAGVERRIGDWRQMGGFVRMLPVSTEKLAARFAIFVTAGPIASLLFAFGTLWLALSFPANDHTRPILEVFEYLAALVLCYMAFAILPGTLIPFTSRGGNATDMKVLITLLQSKRGRDRYIAILMLSREILAGLRARDWTLSYVDLATEMEDGDPEEIRARLLAFYHGQDSGRLEFARAHLNRGVDVAHSLRKKRGVQGDLVLLESALLTALVDHDLELASMKLQEIGDTPEMLEGTRSAVEATIAALRGEREEAERKLSEAEEHIRVVHSRYGGSTEFDHERLSAIRRLI